VYKQYIHMNGDAVNLFFRLKTAPYALILCDTAIKFTPAVGSVKIWAKVFAKVPGYLLVEVSDTGCGIKPELRERTFEHLCQVTEI
jgi:K+-sensing histidine kinase KdpD